MRQEALLTVYKLAKKDPRIVFIGSDLGAGTLKEMQADIPGQFFMEGISEQHIVGFAAGLAQEGFIPYINTIGTFLTRRAFEQVSIDIGLHRLPARLLSSGGGMVYAPLGPTHTAVEDLGLMLSVPNMKVFAPADALEMENLLITLVEDKDPHYVRFGKGGETLVTQEFSTFELKPKIFGNESAEVVIFTTGVLLQHCLEVRSELQAQGYSTTVIHFPYLNHLSIDSLDSYFGSARVRLCVEEHVPRGGLFTQILHELVLARRSLTNLYQVALPASFSHNYGSQIDHLESNGLTAPKILAKIKDLVDSSSKSNRMRI
jgi:transketolase